MSKRSKRQSKKPQRVGGRWHWALPERWRTTISTVTATLLTVPIMLGWQLYGHVEVGNSFVIGFVVAWTLFTVVHLLLTNLAYRKLDEDELRSVLAPVRSQRGRSRPTGWARVRDLLWSRWISSEAPSWSVQVSVMALVIVLVVIATPALQGSQMLLAWTLAMVAGSWADIVIMYALHYAGKDLANHGLEFPGGERRKFSDYVYMALGVQATFGTTDVAITTQSMRRTAMVHMMLAFVFNSVIVALIVSFLLTGLR